jgi:hypothetical protein
MKIDIYRSNKDRTKFLSVPTGTNINTMQFPAGLDPDLQPPLLVQAERGMDIAYGQPRIGLNVDDIMAQIGKKGFAVHGININVTMSPAGRTIQK